MKLSGFLDTDSALNRQTAFKGLSNITRMIAAYESKDLWQIDTENLPGPLQKLRHNARSFARKHLRHRALKLDATGHPYRDEEKQVLKAAAHAGYFSDLLPAPLGSSPVDQYSYPFHLTSAVKIEEFTTECGGLGLMIGAHALGACPLIFSGNAANYLKFALPIFSENKKGNPVIMAYAITEPEAGSDAEDSEGAKHYRPRTVAKKVNGGYLLNGRKVFISGGDHADYITAFAALEGEDMSSWTCFMITKETRGFSTGRNELKMGQRASSATELIFEDAFVPDDHIIGGLRQGWALNRATLNYSRIPVGAIALGIARGALEAAIDFAAKNKLGNKQLLQFQEIQMQIAQMIIDTSAVRSMIWQSSQKWQARQMQASAVKVFASDTAMKVTQSAMDIMGNHGLTHNRAEKAFRDARLTQIYEGTNQINRLGIIEDQIDEFTNKFEV